MTKTRVGECCVDSGQILITDPAYVCDEFDGPLPRKASHGGSNWGYAEAVDITTRAPGHGQLRNGHGAPLGYVTATGVGDGRFPVFVELDAEGKLVALEIRFDQ